MIEAYKLLKANKRKLFKQVYLTIKGQIKSGDYIGAIKGIKNQSLR